MLGICGFIAIVIMPLYMDSAYELICCGSTWYIIVIFVAYYVYYYRLEIVHDHVYSRWDTDKDIVCWRIDVAIWRRGVRPKIDYWGNWVVFPIPPMSIIVRPGRKRTTVFVGPVTGTDPSRVEALKAFVERALGADAEGIPG